jgi:diacylglycerol kinase (ATP)
MRILVIFNPTAGRRRLHRLRRFVDRLQLQGVPVTVAATGFAGHGRVLAQEAAEAGVFTHVVAAGGDGTIAEVADGLGNASTILGILPLGTANVLAHELGLPFDPERNAMAIGAGRSTLIWPGRLTTGGATRLFLQMVGVGFDAQVVHRLSLPFKRRFGKMAYVAQTIAELGRYPFPKLDVTLDGVAHDAYAVVISNGRYYGGRFVMAPDATPAERGFEVSLLDRPGIGAIASTSLALLASRPCWARSVRRFSAMEIGVLSPVDLPAQHDGEDSAMTPLSVTASAFPLRVAVSSFSEEKGAGRVS